MLKGTLKYYFLLPSLWTEDYIYTHGNDQMWPDVNKRVEHGHYNIIKSEYDPSIHIEYKAWPTTQMLCV